MEAALAVHTSAKKGLGVTFTEHVDYADHSEKDPQAADAPRGMGDFVCDFNIYPAQYKKFRGSSVMLGLEIGLTKAFLPANKQLAACDYDFIIGSVHGVDGVDLYKAGTKRKGFMHEPYAQQMHSADTVDECISRYLTYAKEMAELDCFYDAFGHIDYIARYAPLAGENFFYDKFTAEFDALLKALAERGLALEINTCLFGIAHQMKNAEKVMLDICRRFAQLGGRLCTIGSDAHRVERLGHCISSAIEIARDSGLTAVYFKERKAIPCGK
jgi:histidinol-phosphatase (PHP family)